MRTTVTLDADTLVMLQRHMAERKLSFKQAINEAVRAGLTEPVTRGSVPFRTRTADLGVPLVDLDGALTLAGELEDAELIRKMQMNK